MARSKVWTGTEWAYEDVVGGTGASWGSITGTLSNQTDLNTALGNKVDKETGKGLFSGSYNDLTDKPTNVSAFANDAEYLTLGTLPIYNGGVE